MYQLLEKYEVNVAKDEFDKVSDIRFKWRKLRNLVNERNNQIALLQGGFKRDLTAQVERFALEVVAFRKDFDHHGPMVKGIRPQEAMERLKKYQRLYDDKERKWDTYMAGEELFGLPQNEYPELKKTKKVRVRPSGTRPPCAGLRSTRTLPQAHPSRPPAPERCHPR